MKNYSIQLEKIGGALVPFEEQITAANEKEALRKFQIQAWGLSDAEGAHYNDEQLKFCFLQACEQLKITGKVIITEAVAGAGISSLQTAGDMSEPETDTVVDAAVAMVNARRTGESRQRIAPKSAGSSDDAIIDTAVAKANARRSGVEDDASVLNAAVKAVNAGRN